MLRNYLLKISKDTVWVLILNGINYLSSFLLAVLISRFLGLEGLGKYTFVFAFVSILCIISDFGLTTLLIRKINENKFRSKEFILDFNLIKTSISVLLIVVIFSVSLIVKGMSDSVFLIGILLIIPRSLQSTYESSIRSFLNQSLPVIFKSINSFLQLVTSYFLLVKGFGLINIFICILVLDIFTLFVLSLASKRIIRSFNLNSNNSQVLEGSPETNLFNKFITILKESSVFFVNNFLMLSIKSLNVILLGYFSNAASVGIYSAGSRFVNGAGLFSGALFNSFYPVLSNVKKDLKLKIELTKKVLLYSSGFGIIITILIYFFSGILISLTFKTGEAVIVLKILSFSILPVIVYTVTQSFLFTVYNEKFLLKILLGAWCMNIILSIILILKYNYTGCAISLTVTELFLMITQLGKFNYDNKNLALKVSQ